LKYTIDQDLIQTYKNFFRLHAHLLLAWAYKKARPMLRTEDEEEISDTLYQNIQQLLLVEKESWMANYAVKNEDPISGGYRKGRSRREIDLVIVFTGQGRPQYVFEAKVLNWRKSYQRTDNYVNASGMGRFIEGDYADHTAGFPEIGMLGYVLSDSIEEWQKKLKAAIEAKEKELCLLQPQEDVLVCDEVPFEWLSKHTRDSSDLPVTIYHILLDCQGL
jgi:hypothetical protein